MFNNRSYKKTFLSEVVARLDFVPPLPNVENSLSTALVRAASNMFPIVEPGEAISQEISLGGGELRHRQTNVRHWNFFGKEREKMLCISSEFMFIKVARYESYEALLSVWKRMVEAICKQYPDVQASRFGLRYINKVDLPQISRTSDLESYIVDELLIALSFFPQECVVRLFHVLQLNVDDLRLNFQFGFPNPDYPAVIKRPVFVLDLDGFVDSVHSLPESIAYMGAAHKVIQETFEKSITEKLREYMNG